MDTSQFSAPVGLVEETHTIDPFEFDKPLTTPPISVEQTMIKWYYPKFLINLLKKDDAKRGQFLAGLELEHRHFLRKWFLAEREDVQSGKRKCPFCSEGVK